MRAVATLSLVALLPAFLISGHTLAQDTATTTLRVVSFNIRYDNSDDGDNAWQHRKDHVASMLRFHAVDIAGLQEALAHQIADLEQHLPNFDWVGVGRDDGKKKGEFAPIFYRTDRFAVVDSGTFWLSPVPDTPGAPAWDAACPRIATWARLQPISHEGKADASTSRPEPSGFYVFNTHFDHRGTMARKESASLLRNRIHDRKNANDPVVVTGDFNCNESSLPYAVLTDATPKDRPALRDARFASRTPHHGPLTTWNGFGATYVPGRKIDHIFVSPDITVGKHGILSDTFDGRFPSDHLPVLVELTLPSRK